eukprot:g7186.t1
MFYNNQGGDGNGNAPEVLRQERANLRRTLARLHKAALNPEKDLAFDNVEQFLQFLQFSLSHAVRKRKTVVTEKLRLLEEERGNAKTLGEGAGLGAAQLQNDEAAGQQRQEQFRRLEHDLHQVRSDFAFVSARVASLLSSAGSAGEFVTFLGGLGASLEGDSALVILDWIVKAQNHGFDFNRGERGTSRTCSDVLRFLLARIEEDFFTSDLRVVNKVCAATFNISGSEVDDAQREQRVVVDQLTLKCLIDHPSLLPLQHKVQLLTCPRPTSSSSSSRGASSSSSTLDGLKRDVAMQWKRLDPVDMEAWEKTRFEECENKVPRQSYVRALDSAVLEGGRKLKMHLALQLYERACRGMFAPNVPRGHSRGTYLGRGGKGAAGGMTLKDIALAAHPFCLAERVQRGDLQRDVQEALCRELLSRKTEALLPFVSLLSSGFSNVCSCESAFLLWRKKLLPAISKLLSLRNPGILLAGQEGVEKIARKELRKESLGRKTTILRSDQFRLHRKGAAPKRSGTAESIVPIAIRATVSTAFRARCSAPCGLVLVESQSPNICGLFYRGGFFAATRRVVVWLCAAHEQKFHLEAALAAESPTGFAPEAAWRQARFAIGEICFCAARQGGRAGDGAVAGGGEQGLRRENNDYPRAGGPEDGDGVNMGPSAEDSPTGSATVETLDPSPEYQRDSARPPPGAQAEDLVHPRDLHLHDVPVQAASAGKTGHEGEGSAPNVMCGGPNGPQLANRDVQYNPAVPLLTGGPRFINLQQAPLPGIGARTSVGGAATPGSNHPESTTGTPGRSARGGVLGQQQQFGGQGFHLQSVPNVPTHLSSGGTPKLGAKFPNSIDPTSRNYSRGGGGGAISSSSNQRFLHLSIPLDEETTPSFPPEHLQSMETEKLFERLQWCLGLRFDTSHHRLGVLYDDEEVLDYKKQVLKRFAKNVENSEEHRRGRSAIWNVLHDLADKAFDGESLQNNALSERVKVELLAYRRALDEQELSHREKINGLQTAHAAELEKRRESHMEELQTAEAKLQEKLEEQRALHEQRLNNLKETLKETQAELDRVDKLGRERKDQLEENEGKIAMLEGEKEEVEDQLRTATDEITDREQNLQQLLSAHSSLQAAHGSLSAEYQSLQSEYQRSKETLTAEVRKLEENLKKQEAEAAREKLSLQASKEHLYQQATHLQGEYEQTNTLLLGAKDEAKQAIREKEAIVEKMALEKEMAVEKLRKEKEDFASFSVQQTKLGEREMQRFYDDQEKQWVSLLQQRADELKQQKADFHAKLKLAQEKRDTDLFSEYQEEYEKTKREASELKARNSAMQSSLRGVKKELEDTKKQNQMLLMDRTDYAGKLQKALDQKRRMEEKVEELTAFLQNNTTYSEQLSASRMIGSSRSSAPGANFRSGSAGAPVSRKAWGAGPGVFQEVPQELVDSTIKFRAINHNLPNSTLLNPNKPESNLKGGSARPAPAPLNHLVSPRMLGAAGAIVGAGGSSSQPPPSQFGSAVGSAVNSASATPNGGAGGAVLGQMNMLTTGGHNMPSIVRGASVSRAASGSASAQQAFPSASASILDISSITPQLEHTTPGQTPHLTPNVTAAPPAGGAAVAGVEGGRGTTSGDNSFQSIPQQHTPNNLTPNNLTSSVLNRSMFAAESDVGRGGDSKLGALLDDRARMEALVAAKKKELAEKRRRAAAGEVVN